MSTPSLLVDRRIKQIRPLIPPACLLEELPVLPSLIPFIQSARQQCAAIISHSDDRLLVVVGPCSIHDAEAAIDYAQRLAGQAALYKDDLLVAMRVYFEKPRTTVGWKGLINDPLLDGSYAINSGLRLARRLMLDINALQLPVACEMLDTITPQFISDLVAWGAIGARTTESQLHRELVSGLSFPIGFKNGTGGSKRMAVDAITASQSPHCFLSVTTQGLAAIVETEGNRDCHIVLRGSDSGPNYDAQHIRETEAMMEKARLTASVMVDCSHGNSSKQHAQQALVVRSVCEQVAQGSASIMGVMVESNVHEGSQKLECAAGAKERLKYGVSVTDACIGWEQTEDVLRDLSRAVQQRRALRRSTAATAKPLANGDAPPQQRQRSLTVGCSRSLRRIARGAGGSGTASAVFHHRYTHTAAQRTRACYDGSWEAGRWGEKARERCSSSNSDTNSSQ